jgi:hypothetical protein
MVGVQGKVVSSAKMTCPSITKIIYGRLALSMLEMLLLSMPLTPTHACIVAQI